MPKCELTILTTLFVFQLLSHVQFFATPWTAARQASLSITISQSLLKLMSTESWMLSNHLILYCPLLLPSIFHSIRVFPMSRLFTSDCQSIGPSASTSVLPMNIQGWFLLGLTGFISLLIGLDISSQHSESLLDSEWRLVPSTVKTWDMVVPFSEIWGRNTYSLFTLFRSGRGCSTIKNGLYFVAFLFGWVVFPKSALANTAGESFETWVKGMVVMRWRALRVEKPLSESWQVVDESRCCWEMVALFLLDVDVVA